MTNHPVTARMLGAVATVLARGLSGLGLLLLTHFAQATAPDMNFQRLVLDGSSDNDVGSIVTLAQDRHGFLWVGAEYGLARFDGERIKRYSVSGSEAHLDTTYINDIALAPDGTLWVATERGLSWLSETDDRFYQLRPFTDGPNLNYNRIAALAIDSKNQIILARPDGISMYDVKRQLFKHFDLPNNINAYVVAVAVDEDDNIWVGTHGAGLAFFSKHNHRYTFYQHDPDHPGSLADDHITRIVLDNKKRVWVGTKTAGISRLDPGNREFVQLKQNPNNPNTLGHNYIRDVFEDSRNMIWVATDHGGLSLYDEHTGYFHHYKHNAYDPKTLTSNQTREIVEDKNGDLWVGTFPTGLNYFNRSAALFKNFAHEPDDPSSLSHSAILGFLEDSDGDLWVGTENGLNQYHPSTQSFTRYMPEPGFTHALRAGAVVALAEDDHKNIWVGTWSGGLHRFDKKNRRFYNFSPNDKDGSLQSAFIWAIVNDHKGRLWVGTEGAGLALYDAKTNRFEHFVHDEELNSINHNYIWSMLEDHEGQIWIGTTAGLNRFNPDTRMFHNFPRVPNDPTTVDSERIRALYQDSQQRIWVGTQESGLFIYSFDTQKFEHIHQDDGLPSAYVTGFVEDDEGFIWATTTNGAVKIHPKTLKLTVFNQAHGLISNNLYRPAAYKASDGKLFLGSVEGFSIFDPKTVKQYPADAKVFFTGVEVPTKPQARTEQVLPTIKTLEGEPSLTLSHHDTVFTLEFSSLDHRSGENRRYSYRLKGFNDQWIEVDNKNFVTYTNLSPGKYVFSIKAGTLAGWSPNITNLAIHVRPPPWKSWWAYSFYAVLFGSLVGFVAHLKFKQMQLHGEQSVNRKLRALNVMKDAFLANTSHELRTPLNGIIGIAETLRERKVNRDTFTDRNLQLIISSGKRLATLINDILDYSKLANDNLELNTRPVDIYALVENVFLLLEPLTRGKDLKLVNKIKHLAPYVDADENRLQQVLINLVGNGIKYTQQGQVSINFRIENKRAYVYVEDTGVGIEKNKQSEIFEVFNQIQKNRRTRV